MTIHVALKHVTQYRYDRLVGLSAQVLRLRPAPHSRTPILSYSLKVEPENHFINWQQDPFANYLARLNFPDKTREFKITVDLVAEMAVYNPFDFFLEPGAEEYPFDYDEGLARELAPYRVRDEATPRFVDFLERVDVRRQRTVDFLVGLNRQIHQEIKYLIRMEPGVQTPEVTLTRNAGSCRDSAWLLVQALRHLGLAARFVSGYLIQLKPDVKALDGPGGAESDFTDLHAWCEVYLPGAGWIGLDPTSGLLAGEGHIPLAATPEPGSAAPVTGAVDEAEVEFTHTMEVTRIFESPRVTQPYSDDQWQAIRDLGLRIDDRLDQMDVRLTMGGEPTFVSVEDREGAEWNTAALGPTKRGYAVALLNRLRERYGANGFLHFGQGKWYPGEQLPRWALSIYWREDGQACWQDPALFADERERSRYGAADARRFMGALCARLGLGDEYIVPGYEDVFYYLWRERRLPVNVDPFDSRLDDEMERARLRRVFEARLDSVTAMRCRCAGATGRIWTGQPGCPAPGSCAMNACICSRGIRPWATGCRWIRCPGWPRPMRRRCWSAIRSRRGGRCRPQRRCGCSRGPGGRRAGTPARATVRAGTDRRPRARQAMPARPRAPTRTATPAAAPTSSSRPPGSPARRCASRPAPGCCTSSCRRCSAWRTTWTW